MPKGNFAATLVMPVTEEPGVVALRSFVMSLALYDAFRAAGVEEARLALKWPNDVLLSGGKVAGILLESAGDARMLSIGIGVNLAQAPDLSEVEPGALRPVSLRQEADITISPDGFLDHLAASYAVYETQFRTYGFAPIRTAWLAKAAKLGEAVTARTTRETLTGTFRDVDDDGQLVLETAKGRVTVPAADVYF